MMVNHRAEVGLSRAAAFWLVARLADEIGRGVNPWLRLLGSVVAAWRVVGSIG